MESYRGDYICHPWKGHKAPWGWGQETSDRHGLIWTQAYGTPGRSGESPGDHGALRGRVPGALEIKGPRLGSERLGFDGARVPVVGARRVVRADCGDWGQLFQLAVSITEPYAGGTARLRVCGKYGTCADSPDGMKRQEIAMEATGPEESVREGMEPHSGYTERQRATVEQGTMCQIYEAVRSSCNSRKQKYWRGQLGRGRRSTAITQLERE